VAKGYAKVSLLWCYRRSTASLLSLSRPTVELSWLLRRQKFTWTSPVFEAGPPRCSPRGLQGPFIGPGRAEAVESEQHHAPQWLDRHKIEPIVKQSEVASVGRDDPKRSFSSRHRHRSVDHIGGASDAAELTGCPSSPVVEDEDLAQRRT